MGSRGRRELRQQRGQEQEEQRGWQQELGQRVWKGPGQRQRGQPWVAERDVSGEFI